MGPEEPTSEGKSPARDRTTTEEPIEDDNLYCLQGTFVFFQVQRCIFHVPTYRFANESQFFEGMFKIPQPNIPDVEGSSRDSPILMPNDVSKNDFRNFLKALYPLGVSSHLTLSKDEWISVLRLATRWYFLKFRTLAMDELKQGLSSMDKVIFGKEFKICAWFREGCLDFAERDQTISKDEATAIGYETTFALFRIREQRLRGELSIFGGVRNAVDQLFKEELDDIKRFQTEYEQDEPNIELKFPPLPHPFFGNGLGTSGSSFPSTPTHAEVGGSNKKGSGRKSKGKASRVGLVEEVNP